MAPPTTSVHMIKSATLFFVPIPQQLVPPSLSAGDNHGDSLAGCLASQGLSKVCRNGKLTSLLYGIVPINLHFTSSSPCSSLLSLR